jgi:hypothetical protein
MPSLERRYRLLLAAYPAAYRAAHEEEMVATLLDASEPGQIDPSLRETWGLLVNGLRTRSRLAAESGWRALSADATRLAALLLLASVVANSAFLATTAVPLRMRAIPVLAFLAMLAAIRGATRVAVAIVAVTGVVGWMFLLPAWMVPGFPVAGYFDYDVAALLGAAMALVGCSLRGGHRQPWPWPVAAVAALLLAPFLLWEPVRLVSGLSNIVGFHLPLSAFLVGVPVLLLSGASLLANDPRPSIAAAIYAIVNLGALGAAAAAFGVAAPTLLVVLLAVILTTLATGTFSGRRLARPDV